MVATDGETGRGQDKQSMQDTKKKRSERPNVGGVY